MNTVVVGLGPGQLDRARSVAGVGPRDGSVLGRRRGGDRVVVEFEFATDQAAADALRAIRLAGLAAVAGPSGPGHRVAWTNRNAPTHFGPGSCVCQPWSVFDDSSDELVIEIDPGRGFGSGGHPTTVLLLQELATMDLAGRTVLDVGCGTGVLGIAAARLGAGPVVAVDNSPAAIEATMVNARNNEVGEDLQIGPAALADIDGRFDVVVANIHADVLVELAPHLRRLTGPTGRLGLSGLSPAQPSGVAAALGPMTVTSQARRDEWASLWLTHSSHEAVSDDYANIESRSSTAGAK